MRVPRMFTADEFLRIDPRLPPDLDERRREFWSYVEERISALGSRLKKIYLTSVGVPPRKQLEMLRITDPQMYEVVLRGVEQGAELVDAENPELVLETISWMQQLQHSLSASESDKAKLETVGQFLAESMRERDDYLARRIAQTLGDGEVGLLILDDSRNVSLPGDIRVITTCPFQPRDYLNSWLATLRLKDREEQSNQGRESQKPADGEKGER